MYPWLIEEIKRQREQKESQNRVRPSLPVPEPYQYPQEANEGPCSGSVIVNFEL